jgi:hypothetical protein
MNMRRQLFLPAFILLLLFSCQRENRETQLKFFPDNHYLDSTEAGELYKTLYTNYLNIIDEQPINDRNNDCVRFLVATTNHYQVVRIDKTGDHIIVTRKEFQTDSIDVEKFVNKPDEYKKEMRQRYPVKTTTTNGRLDEWNELISALDTNHFWQQPINIKMQCITPYRYALEIKLDKQYKLIEGRMTWKENCKNDNMKIKTLLLYMAEKYNLKYN